MRKLHADILPAKMAELEAWAASSRQGGTADAAPTSARAGAGSGEQALGPAPDADNYLAPPPGSLVGPARLQRAQLGRGGVAAALLGGPLAPVRSLAEDIMVSQQYHRTEKS